MNELFGYTRDVVKARYALRTPAGFVPGWQPGWRDTACVMQISDALGANFRQLLVTLGQTSEGRGNTGLIECVIYILAGTCRAELGGSRHALAAGDYVYLPAEHDFRFSDAAPATQLLIFQKRFQPLAGYEKPELIVGHAKDAPGQPFLGNKDARLQVLLPDKPEFDLAVNIFTYQPGATLPFVESHVMEHGLVMLSGQGIYRLDADWHPVQAGDVIWMAPYCPQWFVAMGRVPASYIYYKDVNREPLL
ncbi:MAG: (S)-ureidoglycine aminohydrolase [Verrucomicrobiota bacterium]|jgi:(S)-ureidoglycine aminohydrolase